MKKLLTYCRPLLLMYLVAIILLAALGLLLGQQSFSPYIKEISSHILSVKDLAIFIILLASAAFLLEYVLRFQIQQRLLKSSAKGSKSLAFLLPLIIGTIMHLPFGIAGFIYGLLSSSLQSWFYIKKRDWKLLAFWQAGWVFIFIPASLAFCVFADGQIRNDFLYSYKKRHILKEKMYYLEGWGWVDTIHYRPDHFKIVHDAVMQADKTGTVTLEDGWVTPLRIPVHFSSTYKFQKSSDELKNWAVITGIMLHFMRKNESVQQHSPWYHGNQLSAWQFDDMSSCLLCCLDHLPEGNQIDRGLEKHDYEKLMEIWKIQGEQLVQQQVREKESWAMLHSPQKEKLMNIVEEMKHCWQCTSGN